MFGRTRRLRRYRRRVESQTLDPANSAEIAEQLARLWREFRVSDFKEIPLDSRTTMVIPMTFRNLPALVDHLREHNRMICLELDRRLELSIAQLGRERTPVLLDFYLADEDQCAVNVQALLRRLQGLLQEHWYLLKGKPSLYYQRHSEVYYRDIINLTRALVAAVR